MRGPPLTAPKEGAALACKPHRLGEGRALYVGAPKAGRGRASRWRTGRYAAGTSPRHAALDQRAPRPGRLCSTTLSRRASAAATTALAVRSRKDDSMDGIAVTASPATPRARAPVPSLPCGGGIVDGKGAGGTRAGAAVDRHARRRRPSTAGGTRATCCSGRPGDGG